MGAYTLLFADLVDSTSLVERLGEMRAAALWEEHDRRARRLFSQHDGREIDRSDGFLLLFERPDDAVRFAGAAAHQGLGRWRVVS
jgi:class 3 adenylate cyclase